MKLNVLTLALAATAFGSLAANAQTVIIEERRTPAVIIEQEPPATSSVTIKERGGFLGTETRSTTETTGTGPNGDCATQRHNAWGYGGGWPNCWNFGSWSDAIWQVTLDIRNYYFDQYHQTNIPSFLIAPPGTGHRWCEGKCASWVSNVSSAYSEQGGDPNTNDLSYAACTGTTSPVPAIPAPPTVPPIPPPAPPTPLPAHLPPSSPLPPASRL